MVPPLHEERDRVVTEATSGALEEVSRCLRGIMLLAGSVRRNRLAIATGRSILDLPLESGLTVLDHWKQEADGVAKSLKMTKLPIRVIVDRHVPEPCLPRR